MYKIVVASRGRNPEDRNERKLHSNGRWVQMLDVCGGGVRSNCLSTVYKDNMVMIYEDCVLCEKAER